MFTASPAEVSGLHDEDSRRQVKKLLEIRHSISSTLAAHEEDIKYIKCAKTVQCQDVIEFANNIAFALRSPRLWTPGFPLIGAAPPAPQAEQMRAGVLASYNKKAAEAKHQPAIETKINASKESTTAHAEPAEPAKRKVAIVDEADVASRKRKATTPEPASTAEPQKKRKVNISFGLDSDSDDEDG